MRRQPKTHLLALLDSLKRLIGGLRCGSPSSDWSGYAAAHSYGDDDFERKRDFVRRHTSARRPRLTWDIGANTGVFSRIAARSSQTVVAVDSDHDTVETLYREARADGQRGIIPLLMDMSNISPGQGWAGP